LLIGLFLLLVSIPVLAEPSPEEVKALEAFKYGMRSDDNINLAELAFTIAKTMYPDINIKDYVDKIDGFADEIKKSLGNDASSPEKALAAINEFLYRKKKFVAESTTKEVILDYFMLNKVVDNSRGNCLGLSTLYWSLAERLNITLQAVVIPQHVFLKYDNGKTVRYIEPTAHGHELTRDYYIKQTRSLIPEMLPKYNIGDDVPFRNISKQQFVGLIFYNRGVYHIKRLKQDDALTDFSSALILDENNHEAIRNRGGIYLQKGQYEEAKSDYQKALRLYDNVPSNYFNMGQVLANLGEFNDSINNYDRAIRLAPDYTDAYHNRGLAYSKQKSFDNALEDLEKAISLDPSNSRIHYNRALTYDQMGETDKAIADDTKSIKLNSVYPEVYNHRGILYVKQEKWPEAESDFKKAIDIVASFPDPYRNLAIVYNKTKKYELALKNTNKYLDLIPKDHVDRKQIEEMKKYLEQMINQSK
jgi:tetratricopeptide (TPR) repeat protein